MTPSKYPAPPGWIQKRQVGCELGIQVRQDVGRGQVAPPAPASRRSDIDVTDIDQVLDRYMGKAVVDKVHTPYYSHVLGRIIKSMNNHLQVLIASADILTT